MTPIHQLMLASKPFIIEALAMDGGPDPTPEDVRLIETAIPTFCRAMRITDADQAYRTFMDMAYRDLLPGIDPQFPRAAIDAAVAKVRAAHPDIWKAAAQQLGLVAQ